MEQVQKEVQKRLIELPNASEENEISILDILKYIAPGTHLRAGIDGISARAS
jgi:DNA integrity scanning protein DisA with diadenylate cyclase activity